MRRWLVAIGLCLTVLLGTAVAVVRVEFEGPDLAENITHMMNARMRGRIAIASIEWPMSAIGKVVTGGWVPVTLRGVEVWDGRGPDAESVLRTERITAEVDLHSLLFGRHDFVLRNVHVHGGHAVLREVTEPYPLHDYDTTVFSLIAAFYGEREAGFRSGIFAATSPLWDLRNYTVEGLELELRTKPLDARGSGYLFRAHIADVRSDGFLYMDPSDPLVPKFYFSLAPKGGAGQIDLYYERGKDGRWPEQGMYSFPVRSLDVRRLAQLPSRWPADPVANSLAFDLSIASADDARIRVRGAMIDYWDTPYGGTWDVNLTIENGGLLVQRSIDADAGGRDVRLEAQVTGPIIFYPSVALKASGLTYQVTALEPPLSLELDTLTGVYDLAVDEGSIDEFIARGAGTVGGEVRISAKFGGDGTNESPLWVDSNVDIREPIDMSTYLPEPLARAAGTRLGGRFHALRRKGDTKYGITVDQLDVALGRLGVAGGQIYLDKSLDKILLNGVRFDMPGFTGTIRCNVFVGGAEPRFDDQDCEADIEIGNIQQLTRAFAPAPKKKATKPTKAVPPKARAIAQPRRRARPLRPPRRLHHAQTSPAPTRATGTPAAAPAPTQATARGTSSKGTVKIGGSLSNPTLEAGLDFDDIPLLGRLRGTFRYQGDQVMIENAVSSSLGGQVRIRGPVALAPSVRLDGVRVQATSIDLAKVAALRMLAGKLSADVVLRGAPDPRQLVVSGWACSNKVVALGDTLADLGLWLNRAPDKLSCPAVTAPARTPIIDACLKVGTAGGRCAVAQARREAGGELALVASADRSQRLGGELRLARMPLPALLALVGAKLPVGAFLDTAGLQLGGTIDAPTIDGTVRVTRAWLERGYLGDGELVVRADRPGQISLAGSFLDGRVQVSGTLATRAPYALDLTAELSHVELDAFADPVAFGLPRDAHAWVSGRVKLATKLGDDRAPLTAQLDLNDLSVSATLPGPDGQPLPVAIRAAAPIALVYDGVTARLAQPALLQTPFGVITVRGSASRAAVDLSATGTLALAKAQPLTGRLFDRMGGTVALTARVTGVTIKPRIQLILDLDEVELGLARQDAVLRVPAGRIQLTDGDLSFTGVSVEVEDGRPGDRPALNVAGGIILDGLTPTRWSIIVSGSLPGEMLLAFAPETFSQASGTANLEINLSGEGATPRVSGDLSFGKSRPEDDPDRRPLSLLPRSLRREIALDAGTVSFSGDSADDLTIELTEVSGTIDHVGRLQSVDGAVRLARGELEELRVTASAQGLPFRIQRTLDLVLDVDGLEIELERGDLALTGQVKIVSGRFIRGFDLGEFLTPSDTAGPSTPSFWEASPILGNARLELAIDTRKFSVVNNIANIELEGGVDVTGTPRDPRLEGEIRVSRGTFRMPGVRARFTRTSGTVLFEPNLRIPATPSLSIRSEADYRDPSGQDHLVTLTIDGSLSRPSWDLTTASGLNKAQTLVLIVSGRAPDDVRRSLGDQAISDPTRIDPSTSASQGYADELLKDVASDRLEKWVGDTLRDISGLDVARIELNFGSFGFHAEKRLLENVGLIGDLERTTRGSTASGRLELRLPPQTFKGAWLLEYIPGWHRLNESITALAGEARMLSKNYDDAAERDINDLELKAVIRILLAR